MKSKQVVNPARAFEYALTSIWDDGTWVGAKKEILNLVVEIEHPTVVGDRHDYIVDKLNEFYDPAEDGTPHFEVVQNWTFPDTVQTGLTDNPRPTQDSGEYYTRLCESEKGNQLISMVDKIEKWGRNNRTIAQVFNVDDHLNAMFPPCLTQIQAFYRDDGLHLTAYYRSHTLCKSYYGDVVSVAKLQAWLADKVDAEVGSLTIISGSAHIRKKDNEHKLAEDMVESISTKH